VSFVWTRYSNVLVIVSVSIVFPEMSLLFKRTNQMCSSNISIVLFFKRTNQLRSYCFYCLHEVLLLFKRTNQERPLCSSSIIRQWRLCVNSVYSNTEILKKAFFCAFIRSITVFSSQNYCMECIHMSIKLTNDVILFCFSISLLLSFSSQGHRVNRV